MDSDPIPQTETTVSLSPAAMPRLESNETHPPAESDYSSVLLSRLLKMADAYRAANQIHQASEMYFQLIERYSDTPEAARALERMIEIGDDHERNGELRQARSIFERLL